MRSPRRPLLASLLAAAGVGALAQSVAGPAGALLAAELGGVVLSGAPQAAIVIGSAAGAIGIGRANGRMGRVRALMGGAAIGAVGAGVVLWGAVSSSVWVVIAGSAVFGVGNAAIMLARYAAADAVPAERRVRAMSTALVATTVGSVIGPNLLAPSGFIAAVIGVPAAAGPYVVAVAALAAAAFGFAMPGAPRAGRQTATEATADSDPARASGGSASLGIALMSLSNLVMVGVMTGVPVHLEHAQHSLGTIGLVVSLHIAAMFAPSPLSGRLVQSIGARRTALAGAAVLGTASVGAAVAANVLPALTAAMAMLGLGWNLVLVAGSAMLLGDAPVAERARREGWGEVGMGVAAAGGGFGSGLIVASAGYPPLALAGAIASLALLIVVCAAPTPVRTDPSTPASRRTEHR